MVANTYSADVNEVLLGYYCLGSKGSWSGFVKSTEAKHQLNLRKDQIGEDEYSIRSEQAKVMAIESLKWAKANGYKGKVKHVWWTARPGVLAKAVKKDVDSRKNPTDTLLQFSDKQFLGLSAKSTKSKGDIGFKNPGIGTVDKALGLNLKGIYTKIESDMVIKMKLPISKSIRKNFLRQNKTIQTKTIAIGIDVLNKIATALFKKLKSMTNAQLIDYILSYWMDAEKVYPPYIKITGTGNKAPFGAHILDPLKNNKIAMMQKEKIKLSRIGNESIGIMAGNKKIFKMRVKFESEKMASSLKFSGDPW